jgi:glycosyltransferase involved in cell wall biosynthesis
MSDRKSLLYAVFPTFDVGGAQRRYVAVANRFPGKFRHCITALDGRTGASTLFAPEVEYDERSFPEAGTGLKRIYTAARRQIRDINPDVLITHNWGAVEIAAANLPRLTRHIHIEDGFGTDEAVTQIPRRVWFRRIVLRWHSTVVLPSLNLLRIARETWRLPEGSLRYVPNGIACDKFQREPDPAVVAKIKGNGPVIGTVAALRREKALDRLIRAFHATRAQTQARLVIVGDGQERASLEALVQRLDIAGDVTFLGHIAQPETVLGAFDVFALSSDTEQMPLSVLEAMAAGLPVASVDVGDVRHMLATPNKASVVPLRDQDLAGALTRLITNPAERKTLGDANRAKARAEFDQETMFATYEKLFGEAVSVSGD